MAKSKLKVTALNIYKSHPLASWVLGLTSGLLMTAVLFIGVVVSGLNTVLFPIICLPIIFSATLSHLFLTRGKALEARSSVKYGFSYFKPNFVSSFRFWMSLLKAIIVSFIAEFILSLIATYVIQAFNPSFNDSLQDLYNLLQSDSFNMDSITTIIYSNGGVLFIYICSVIYPSIYIAIIFFIYNISRESISIYLRLALPNIPPRLLMLTYTNLVRKKRWQMLRDYLSLNWPLFVLLPLGMIAGVTISKLFITDNVLTIYSYGIVGGAFFSTFFLPFYFANNESFFAKYENDFKISMDEVTQMLLANMQQNIEMTQEEKDRLEKSLNNGENPLNDDLNKKDDEGNKKDPDGSQ